MKKRLVSFITAIVVIFGMTSCVGQQNGQTNTGNKDLYYPENDIITFEELRDDDRMVIVIDTQHNVTTSNIEEVIEAEFPEINVMMRLQNTADSSYYTEKSLEHGLLGDIFFCVVGMPKDEEVLEENFIELSDMPFIKNYYQNSLDSVAVNGKIYALPGFSDLFGIIYDRTLFEERGWKLPSGRDEFIALCKTIEEEEGYQAFMPTLKYGRMAMLISHAFHYDRVIAGLNNQKWLQSYRKGEASFSGHMEPMFEGMKELFDEGVLSIGNFTVDPGMRSEMLYTQYTTAMTMETQQAGTYATNAGSEHKYGMMPFWNSNDPDSDYLVAAQGFNIYANKQLEQPENARKLEKVMEILEYLSTTEGQRALMPLESISISHVKGTDGTSAGSFMEGVSDTIAKGNIFSEVRYTELAHNNDFQRAFREALIGYVNGTMDMESAMEHCDTAMQKLKNQVEEEKTVYGRAAATFTTLETAEFVADILCREAEADLALVLAKQLNYGESGNFYKGDITEDDLKLVTLDYVSGKNPEYNRLVTVNLTGEQILAILNYPNMENLASDVRGKWVNQDNPVYWVPSNMKIEYAPFLTENSIISMKNMDGSDFDLKKTYKVALWNGCFSNLTKTEYFDDATLDAMAAVTPVSDKTSLDLIKEALAETDEIKPTSDGRFTIRWDIKSQEDVEK